MNEKHEEIVKYRDELVEKLQVKKANHLPRITLGQAILLKYPGKIKAKQVKRLRTLSRNSNDSIKLRDACRAIGIPYEHKYIKNRTVVTEDEEGNPKFSLDYGTRIISL